MHEDQQVWDFQLLLKMNGSFGHDLLIRQRKAKLSRHKPEKSFDTMKQIKQSTTTTTSTTNNQTTPSTKARSKPLPIKVDEKSKSKSNHSSISSTLSPFTPSTTIITPSLSTTQISPFSIPSTPRSPPSSNRHHPHKKHKNSKKSNQKNRTHVRLKYIIYTTQCTIYKFMYAQAPILMFPCNNNQCNKDNQQFHKKSKAMDPRISLQCGIDHLLSPSKCSKRYLSAYCLNLHQLTTAEHLLDAMITKCSPLIKQLHHMMMTSQEQKQKNVKISPSASPILSSSSSLTPSPPCNPINDVMIPPKTQKLASSQPMHAHHPSIPESNLECVETRSCPDLDGVLLYHNNDISDDYNHSHSPPQTTPTLITSKSTPNIIFKSTTINKQKSTKMKAYCIATIKHIIDTLYHWIYYYPQDFAECKLLNCLLTFMRNYREHTPLELIKINQRWNKLFTLIQHRKPEMKYQNILNAPISNLRISPKVIKENGGKNNKKTSFQFTDSFFPPREMVKKLLGNGQNINLLHIHPQLIADQLTLIDTEIFLQIKLREFTNKSWQSGSKSLDLIMRNEEYDNLYEALHEQKIQSPNLIYMIDHVNRLSLWVATEVLSQNTTAQMADMCKYFYVVAFQCLQLNNVHTCTAIFCGICLQPLTRLRRLNRYLSEDEQIQNLHQTLSQLVASNNNYKEYRDFIQQWFDCGQKRRRPCMPFIPVVMKDLFQIQLQMVQRVDDNKVVDLGLLEKNCCHIRRIYECQQAAKLYANQLPQDTDIQSKLRMNIAKFETHETLKAWSFEIQPRLTKEDKENLEMIDTLEEFGFL